MLKNQLWQGGIRALLNYDNTIFDNMVVPEDVNISDIVDHIIMRFGDAPLAVPDPAVIKYYIGKWSSRRLFIWERFKKAIELEYNPIENYNRSEESSNEFMPGSTREYQISADNASTYQPDRKEISSGKDESSFTSKISGNIGVTTSQQMLNSELDILARLDLLEFIAEDFHEEFNLMIYN